MVAVYTYPELYGGRCQPLFAERGHKVIQVSLRYFTLAPKFIVI